MMFSSLLLLPLFCVSFVRGNFRSPSSSEGVSPPENKLGGPGGEGRDLPLLRLCCPDQFYYDTAVSDCRPASETLHVDAFTADGRYVRQDELNLTLVFGLNSCDSYMLPRTQFRVAPSGKLVLKPSDDPFDSQEEHQVNNDDFCVFWLDHNGSLQMSALICFPEENIEVVSFKKLVRGYLLPISMTISALFLAATFFVYCLVRELQDLLGRSLMCSVAFLCLSKVFGVVANAFVKRLTMHQCVILAILMHLGFLHAFFWLNVISIILFCTICFQANRSKYSTRKWFTIGCIYAIVGPLIIISIALIHDFTNIFDAFTIPKPGFGVSSCGFTNRFAQVVYFYAPVSVLLCVNLILFCGCAYKLYILSKNSTASVFQFKHYLKLLFLMGIPWIFEVLSFFFADNEHITISTFVWLGFDIFNALQGVVIFIVFACRRTVFARLAEVLCGSGYARRKYPEVFLQHTNDMTQETCTLDLRLMDAEKMNNSNAHSLT